MRSYKLFLLGVVILIGSVLINGCNIAEKAPASNVIAILNGEEITIEDVKKSMKTTEIGLKISAKMEGNTDNIGPEEEVEEFFDRQIEEAQTEAEKRHYERMKREYNNQYIKSENDVFNRIIRQVIQSQEAKKQGYEITIEEAREFRNQMDDTTRTMLEQEGKTEELKKIKELDEEIAILLGFKNREEWFEASLIGTANSMARSRMKEKFIDFLMKTYPNIQGDQWVALRSNAWEEYTEYLLRNSRMKIYNTDFQVVYYEGNWQLGNFNLKNK